MQHPIAGGRLVTQETGMAHSRRSVLVGIPLFAAALAIPAAARTASLTWQSPVALRTPQVTLDPDLPALKVDYPQEVDLRIRYVRRGSDDSSGCRHPGREDTVEAAVPTGAAAVYLGGTRYELRQFHFHTPSEHLLDGRRFPVEQHFVHVGPDGGLLVLALFLTGGGSGNTLQDRALAQLPGKCDSEKHLKRAYLAASLPENLTTFRYEGSLTTSPYTEAISWLVLRQDRRMLTENLDRFRRLFPGSNARDLQPLHGRTVRLRVQPSEQ